MNLFQNQFVFHITNDLTDLSDSSFESFSSSSISFRFDDRLFLFVFGIWYPFVMPVRAFFSQYKVSTDHQS